MKNLKNGILVLLMAVSSLSWGQEQVPAMQHAAKTPAERATMQSKRLTEKLALNPDQQKSIYDFCLQRAQQEDADRAKFQNDMEAMKNGRKQNEQSFEVNLAGVLTADQKTKYEQMKQEQKEKRKEKGGYHSGQKR